ncbi:hypothetical protein POM88_021910 [Heracleum sosnowskyi]|uniref:Uncharacterized protein n=1 Tax=Heracleum sosnowskyi TaxID=360622 RepID=A0AAD8IHT6_9APIA|nr:hypothetical protein POM88_021910 [Heracleum sosnowskyi]
MIDDIDSALKLRNVEPIYGYAFGDPLRFKRPLGYTDLFYFNDKDMDFKDVTEAPVLKAPLDTSIVCHWLAIEDKSVGDAGEMHWDLEASLRTTVMIESIVDAKADSQHGKSTCYSQFLPSTATPLKMQSMMFRICFLASTRLGSSRAWASDIFK